ncbi:MAG: RecQ family ATP-dependent DNA helicase [Cyclobacteriaceae bacterium]|nr:RecQ family ATP-dependent DNA helicase [Cyclobacteriaceae bacterium]MDW8331557.1 ATP-dependent DNA helicase RecQ [Cyclobacteriaceae bacterium]
MDDPLLILQKYWKYNHFRPLQREIIHAVLEGKDVLAILPTGGGKSLCYQIPALMRDGLCLVISPLIALMKDQVEALQRRNIDALAIHSGMSRYAIDRTLDNAVFGNYKFLYISPERLGSNLFRERLQQMKINLLAVDEAHCISQWGHDFRPAYLQIGKIRESLPDVQVIAVTATATNRVRQDIIRHLSFGKEQQVFQHTFARDNLSMVVRQTENKSGKLLEALKRVPGAAIVYARSRQQTHELSEWLTNQGIPSTYYHAGMTYDQRMKNQENWLKNTVRVMVATNAFGMGIDKPDVRLVIHMDLPDNIESYYQEAGRAGRDGKRAYALLLYQPPDAAALENRIAQSQPELPFIKQTYQALANYFQLPVGSGGNQSFDFDLQLFCDRYDLHPQAVYGALKKLEEEGLVVFNESFYSPSELRIIVKHEDLYAFQVANARFDPLIKMLLRLYGGQLYSSYVHISERYLAQSLKTTEEEIKNFLHQLHAQQIIEYQPVKDSPQIFFILPRQDVEHLPINHSRMRVRRELVLSQARSMIAFAENASLCRMNFVQQYFGESVFQKCGKCDVCLEKLKEQQTESVRILREQILRLLQGNAYAPDELEQLVKPKDNKIFNEILRSLVDEGLVYYDNSWRLNKSQI